MIFRILTSLPTASITQLKQPYCISMIISSIPLDHRSCHIFSSLICLPLSTPLTIRVSSSSLPSIFLLVVFLKGLFSVLYFLSCIPPHSALSPPLSLKQYLCRWHSTFSYSILVTLTQVSSTFKPLCNRFPPGCLQIFLLLTQKTNFLIIGLRKQLPIDNS